MTWLQTIKIPLKRCIWWIELKGWKHKKCMRLKYLSHEKIFSFFIKWKSCYAFQYIEIVNHITCTKVYFESIPLTKTFQYFKCRDRNLIKICLKLKLFIKNIFTQSAATSKIVAPVKTIHNFALAVYKNIQISLYSNLHN